MTKQYRVAMVAACPFPCPRGTPIRALRMAEALGRRGNEVHVVTYHLGEPLETDAFRVHRIPNVPTYRRLDPGPTYQKLFVLDPLLAFALARLLAKREIDVIHAHHFEGLIASLLVRRTGTPPIVFDAHTLLTSEIEYYGLGLPAALKRQIAGLIDRRLPALAQHTIAVATPIKTSLLASGGIPAENISVIPSGVNLELFDVDQPPGRQSTEQTLVFTGNLAPYQGIDLMLRAFAELRQFRQDARLRIISEMPFHSYEAQARELGIREAIDTVRAGFEVVPRELAEATIALNPRTECPGVPQKLLNYMAAGKPVVSFAGSAKLLTHRESGWVVADCDVQAFARGIAKLLDEPSLALRLGENARAFVKAELSWTQTAKRTEAVYARVIAEADRG